MAASEREFDIVLFGATGFTGQIVAEYLVQKRAPVRWALAGRSPEKLERVRTQLGEIDPAAREIPIVVGDSLDRSAVDAIARRARVVCTTVGPYVRYGGPLVAACAAAGTHYCDLTGEPPFVRKMIDEHHARAEDTGARIVHACGFDSIPSDLGVLMLHRHFEKGSDRLARAHLRVVDVTGGFSGGTVASMMNLAENMGDPAVRRALGDPYSLNPEGSVRGRDKGERMIPGRDEDGHFTAPFVMAGVNTRIVRRSNALSGYAYGTDFRYDEAIDAGAGAGGLAKACVVSVATLGGLTLMGLPPTRKLLSRFLPAPGEGPSKAARERGHFRVEIHGESDRGRKATAVIAGKLDPGYGQTAVMLGESALCLAQDALSSKGGVLTPATAMGMTLVDRLRAAGMTFEVH